jgi:hypothetical protein
MRRAFVFGCLVLTGCATKYQDMGFTGGVAAQQLTSDTFRISARGNGYTDQTLIQDYTMLKAAETTRQQSGTHFMLVGSADASRTDEVVTPGSAQTTIAGNMAFTTYNPAQVQTFFKPGQDVFIRILTVKPGQAAPPGAISAEEIIKYVGPRVKRG